MVTTEKVRTRSYAELASQITAVETMGRWIARSRMFGCQTEEQGCVIAMDCFLTGMPPLEYQARNSLVMGRPSIPYDAMLAAFRKSGGRVEVRSKTPELASVTLSIDGQSKEFSLTWEEAQREPFVYEGKESEIVAMLSQGKVPALKPKYATPRSRAIMLFARVVSDGIRTMAPEVNFGNYTPEEVEDFSPTPPASAAMSSNGESATKTAPTAQPETPPAEMTSKLIAPEGGPGSIALDDPLTQELREKIVDLMRQVKQQGASDIVERVKAKLAQHNLASLNDMTIAEGELLVRALETKQIELWFDASLAGCAKSPQ